jgi:hypothetical protein
MRDTTNYGLIIHVRTKKINRQFSCHSDIDSCLRKTAYFMMVISQSRGKLKNTSRQETAANPAHEKSMT